MNYHDDVHPRAGFIQNNKGLLHNVILLDDDDDDEIGDVLVIEDDDDTFINRIDEADDVIITEVIPPNNTAIENVIDLTGEDDSDGQLGAGSDGQLVTGSDGQLVTGSDGQLVTGSDGQLVTGSDGQLGAGSDGQLGAGSDGQSSVPQLDESEPMEIDPPESDVPDNIVDLSRYNKVYQCQYCDTVIKDAHKMIKHLQAERHYSANFVYATADNTVVYLITPSKLICKDAAWQRIVSTCPIPACTKTYNDALLCANHIFMKHTPGKFGVYSVTHIIHREEVDLESAIASKQCQTCGGHFEDLVKHCQSKHHYPFKMTPGHVNLFGCGSCSKSFYQFHSACDHIRSTTKHGKSKLLVLTLGKVNSGERLSEFPPDIPANRINWKAVFGQIQT